jgi:hypothetical protein
LSFQKRVCGDVNITALAAAAHVSYLVSVTPEEVLSADVLVRVLGLLLTGVDVLLVGNVLPVSIPPQLGVDGGKDDARDGDAVVASSASVL